MVVDIVERDFHCFRKSYDSINIFCPATHVSLLRSAKNEWLNFNFIVDIQKANSFWPVKLMCCACYKMDIKVLQVKREMCHCLNCIAVKNCVVLQTYLAYFFQR